MIFLIVSWLVIKNTTIDIVIIFLILLMAKKWS